MSDMRIGIYRITCVASGWVYIGKSNNLLTRWMFHRFKLDGNRHMNKRMQRQWNHYGASNFRFEVIEAYDEVHDEYLAERERFWINHHKKAGDNLFNVHGVLR